MKQMIREFKEFAVKGNVVDLAVGLIIGGAFGRIVDSLVRDILMPPIGVILKGVDFSNLKVVLLPGVPPATVTSVPSAAPTAPSPGAILTNISSNAEEVAIRYGQFLNTLIHFLIVALAVYLLVKQINRLKAQLEKPTRTTCECPFCTSIISVRAIRCPQCTADLPLPQGAEAN